MTWFLRKFSAFRKLEADLSLAKLDMLRFQCERDAALKSVEEMKAEAVRVATIARNNDFLYATTQSRVAGLLGIIHDHETTIAQLTAALNKKPVRAKSTRSKSK